MKDFDKDTVATLIKYAAEHYIVPRFKLLQDHEIESKTNPTDLVTQADLDTERFFSSVLEALLPESIVIGEEGVSQNPASLNILFDDARPVWVVDPVDGTFNFVHGREHFGVMVALVYQGQTRCGWIYNIPGDEMLIAEEGAGAYLDEARMRVQTKSGVENLAGFINPKYFPRKHQEFIKSARTRFSECQSLGCAAHEYLSVVKGEKQFTVYSRLKPWDHLPGALAVQEAGGHVAKWDGQPYQAYDHTVGLIAAANEENWQDAYDVFLKDMIEANR